MQPRRTGEWRQRPGESERKEKLVGRIKFLAQLVDLVLKRQQHARVDLKGQMEIKRPIAPLLRVKVNLPCLAQRIRLHEMSFVVHVKSVIDGCVVLEVGDVAGNVDDCHGSASLQLARWFDSRVIWGATETGSIQEPAQHREFRRI